MPPELLPSPGLGTMGNENPDTIAEAIDIGYRHIDTAQKYGNEAELGEGIARAQVSRDNLFLATKVAEDSFAHDDVLRTTSESLNGLKVDTIDLLYVHWPAQSDRSNRYDAEETLAAFNELQEKGVIRHVGAANFSVELLAEARQYLDEPVFANQVEMHPLLQQEELVAYAQEHNMYLVAYCPLMRGGIGDVPELREIAAKHGVSPAQVSLTWIMSKDQVVPIPMSGGVHLRENFEAGNLELDAADLAKIDEIEREERVVDPPKGPWNW